MDGKLVISFTTLNIRPVIIIPGRKGIIHQAIAAAQVDVMLLGDSVLINIFIQVLFQIQPSIGIDLGVSLGLGNTAISFIIQDLDYGRNYGPIIIIRKISIIIPLFKQVLFHINKIRAAHLGLRRIIQVWFFLYSCIGRNGNMERLIVFALFSSNYN